MSAPAQIHFGRIDSYVWFGAGKLLLDCAVRLAREGSPVAVFSAERHLNDVVDGRRTLAQALEAQNVPWYASANINVDERLAAHVGPATLGIAMGPAWIFRKPVCELFGERLLNFMGIDLPRLRGGAHYTWQLLMNDRAGACNLQLINTVVDSGAVVKRREYQFPPTARTPQDFFDFAGPIERAFLEEFLQEVKSESSFEAMPLQEQFAQYFPYLSTMSQGYMNWEWSVDELERFVGAFGTPYAGASTFLDARRVFLHDCDADYGDGTFHPFMAGLVYARRSGALCVAASGGTLVVRRVLDEKGVDLTASVRLGRRFHTPREVLDRAAAFRAVYTSRGLNTE